MRRFAHTESTSQRADHGVAYSAAGSPGGSVSYLRERGLAAASSSSSPLHSGSPSALAPPALHEVSNVGYLLASAGQHRGPMTRPPVIPISDYNTVSGLRRGAQHGSGSPAVDRGLPSLQEVFQIWNFSYCEVARFVTHYCFACPKTLDLNSSDITLPGSEPIFATAGCKGAAREYESLRGRLQCGVSWR